MQFGWLEETTRIFLPIIQPEDHLSFSANPRLKKIEELSTAIVQSEIA